MREKIGFLLWLAGVVAGGSLLLTVFSLGGDSWRIALVIAVPVILFFLAAFPTTGYYLARRIFFYVGLLGWILLILAILGGMFAAEFVSQFLIYSGICIILFTTSATINNNRIGAR